MIRATPRLGPYKIIDYLGRGGMGIVLKAYEESLDRVVALKILRPELAEEPVALERFTREAKAAAALNHPNIVAVHAVGQKGGVPFIAMEYVEGPSLAEVIKSCPVASDPRVGRSPEQAPDSPTTTAPGNPPIDIRNPDTIRDIFRQLLEALAAAHAAGLIHRDIKSSNILLTPSATMAQQPVAGEEQQPRAAVPHNPEVRIPNPESCKLNPESSFRVKLADFGLARMENSQTRMTAADSILGTPEYMSPEQARGDEDIDARSDLYSAGVVLYEMLTGRTPFKANTPMAMIHQIIHVEPPAPETINIDVDPVLANMSLRLMAKKRGDRLASSTEAMLALETRKRLGLLAKRWRFRRYMTIGFPIIASSVAILWVLSDSWRQQPVSAVSQPDATTITAVKRDEVDTLKILARHGYDDENGWRDFYTFPERAEHIVGDPEIISNTDGRICVVAGLQRPLEGACLFMFDEDSEEIWREDLSDGRQWPDCSLPRKWGCRSLRVADVDGDSENEIVVCAGDTHEYPNGLFVIDPRSMDIRCAFWHAGGLSGFEMLPGFFEDGRSAILVWGMNNKLDGEGETVPPDYTGRRYADGAIVSVVAILDPDTMHGIGPPWEDFMRSSLGEAPRARPYAYAILNVPTDDMPYYTLGEDELIVATRLDQIQISSCSDSGGYAPNDGTEPWLAVTLERRVDEPDEGGGTLIVDRNLNVRDFLPSASETIGRNKEYWLALWRPFIQNREWIGG